MIVIDGHLDLSWNALNWCRDLTLPVEEIRRAEAGMKEQHRGANTVCFPEMRKGEVAISLATLMARSSGLKEPLLTTPIDKWLPPWPGANWRITESWRRWGSCEC